MASGLEDQAIEEHMQTSLTPTGTAGDPPCKGQVHRNSATTASGQDGAASFQEGPAMQPLSPCKQQPFKSEREEIQQSTQKATDASSDSPCKRQRLENSATSASGHDGEASGLENQVMEAKLGQFVAALGQDGATSGPDVTPPGHRDLIAACQEEPLTQPLSPCKEKPSESDDQLGGSQENLVWGFQDGTACGQEDQAEAVDLSKIWSRRLRQHPSDVSDACSAAFEALSDAEVQGQAPASPQACVDQNQHLLDVDDNVHTAADDATALIAWWSSMNDLREDRRSIIML